MNIVIVYGKIISKVDFKFIYDRYKSDKNSEEKYKHTSIARCKIELLNSSIVEVYGYDEVADYMYRKFKQDNFILIEGRLKNDMTIEIKLKV